jgi:hypothetical protein
MSVYAYPSAAAVADGGRAGLGVAIVGTPLLFAEPAPVIAVLLALLLVVFLGFGGVTLYRHIGRVEADAAALTVNGRRLPWPEVRAVRLAYFSTRRDRDNGWFQLTVAGNAGRLTVDSALGGFRAIAGRAALSAVTNGVALDAASRANFAALAIPLPAEADA